MGSSILLASSCEETKREVMAFLLEKAYRVRAVTRGSEALLALVEVPLGIQHAFNGCRRWTR